jgi:MerR family transcriptional regulator, copper efflux regulator
MEGGITRNEAAASLGVSPSMLLYYEKRGLLRVPGRSEGGYRLYSQADIDRMTLILKAKGLGLSLREIAELLAGIESGATQERFLEGIRAKIGEIRGDIRALEARARALEELAASPRAGDCAAIRAVSSAALADREPIGRP